MNQSDTTTNNRYHREYNNKPTTQIENPTLILRTVEAGALSVLSFEEAPI